MKTVKMCIGELMSLPEIVDVKRVSVARMQRRTHCFIVPPIAKSQREAEELFNKMFSDVVFNEFVGHYSLFEQIRCGWFRVLIKTLLVIENKSIDIVI